MTAFPRPIASRITIGIVSSRDGRTTASASFSSVSASEWSSASINSTCFPDRPRGSSASRKTRRPRTRPAILNELRARVAGSSLVNRLDQNILAFPRLELNPGSRNAIDSFSASRKNRRSRNAVGNHLDRREREAFVNPRGLPRGRDQKICHVQRRPDFRNRADQPHGDERFVQIPKHRPLLQMRGPHRRPARDRVGDDHVESRQVLAASVVLEIGQQRRLHHRRDAVRAPASPKSARDPGVATATSHPAFCSQRTRWTSWIGAPLKRRFVRDKQNARRPGRLRYPAPSLTASVALAAPRAAREITSAISWRKFRAKALHREILFVGRARLFSQLTRQRRILDQAADGGRQRVRRFRPNEQCILAFDQNFERAADDRGDQSLSRDSSLPEWSRSASLRRATGKQSHQPRASASIASAWFRAPCDREILRSSSPRLPPSAKNPDRGSRPAI